MPAILNARTLARRWPAAALRATDRQLGPQPVAPSVAFVALEFMHNLCGQLIEALSAMDAEVVKLSEVRSSREQVAAIVRVVAQESGITVNELLCPRRQRALARPRQVLMALCKDLTPLSFPVIGRHIGGRDHTTVMHAVRTVAQRIAAGDQDTIRLYEAAKRRLER